MECATRCEWACIEAGRLCDITRIGLRVWVSWQATASWRRTFLQADTDAVAQPERRCRNCAVAGTNFGQLPNPTPAHEEISFFLMHGSPSEPCLLVSFVAAEIHPMPPADLKFLLQGSTRSCQSKKPLSHAYGTAYRDKSAQERTRWHVEQFLVRLRGYDRILMVRGRRQNQTRSYVRFGHSFPFSFWDGNHKIVR